MKEKGKVINMVTITIILMLAVIAVAGFVFFNKERDTFKLNSENKYTIETDVKWQTMRDDGGSHTNVYYNVDLDNNIVSKIESKYEANLGGKSETTINIIYKKKIDSNIQKDLKQLLDETLKKELVDDRDDFMFFTIYNLNVEKIIRNVEITEKIENILELIDES